MTDPQNKETVLDILNENAPVGLEMEIKGHKVTGAIYPLDHAAWCDVIVEIPKHYPFLSLRKAKQEILPEVENSLRSNFVTSNRIRMSWKEEKTTKEYKNYVFTTKARRKANG